MGKNVIVACDFSTKEELEKFLDKMSGVDPNFYCKVGMELFYAGALKGFNPVKMIKERGYKVFLDLKIKDMPNTVSNTIKLLVESNIDMLDVHADGGYKMMETIVEAINKIYKGYEDKIVEYTKYEFESIGDIQKTEQLIQRLKEKIKNKPILIGVTVLPSTEEETEEEKNKKMKKAIRLAKACKSAGFDGVMCQVEDSVAVKMECGMKFITVTPGMEYSKFKEGRLITPSYANVIGSDYIIIGSPVINNSNPLDVFNKYKREFTQTVEDDTEYEKATKCREELVKLAYENKEK